MTDIEGDLRAAPMSELTIAMLSNYEEAERRQVPDEVARRWSLAAEQHALTWRALADGSLLDGPQGRFDAGPIEEARQYLATVNLVHELWVLQEVEVEPQALFHDPANVQRVIALLQRESERGDPLYSPAGELIDVPYPAGEADAHLAHWTQAALFGHGETLLSDQRRLAGSMSQEILLNRFLACSFALSELRGPWSLEAYLANPVGKRLHEPQPLPGSDTALFGLDVALGRRGEVITPAEVDAAHTAVASKLSEQMRRIARDDPPWPADAGYAYASPDQYAREHADALEFTDFLGTALAVTSLAADHTARLDGRPVPQDNLAWLLGVHRDSVGNLNRFAGTLSVAGLRIGFESENGSPVAVVDAAGVTARMGPDFFATMMAVIERPDAVSVVARMRVGLDLSSVERQRPNTKPLRVDPRARPGTPAAQHVAQRPSPNRPRRER